MTRWLVTGAGGQLGTDVVELLNAYRADVVGSDHASLDITDAAAVDRALSAAAPTVVVNCAAYTNVDGAETDEAAATALNGAAPGHLAAWCAANNARLIHVSTDYVFSGSAATPYDVDEPVAPRSAYGRSKAVGERAVLAAGGDGHIVRTAWVYGVAGANFVKTIARLAGERETIDVVDDQRGSPTWSLHLARGLTALGVADVPSGLWHCTGGGETTWHGLASAVFEELGLDPSRVHPTTTAAFPRPAPRPAYSVLSARKWIDAGLPELPDWREALQEAVKTMGRDLTS
ncbi:MAG TPA: dTDP-4-dehydrorhamnose reductase [Mycobacteriales bacterium]|jgi:dTDP-4-dehydrorhamnose reductase|nr:dTDP-4-dehydrorhamnose reductase [Mycobacteriales bacterium]